MKKKTVIILLIAIVALLATLYWFIIKPFDGVNMDEKAKDYAVNFDEINKQLFFRARVWGIAGNHEEIILSNLPTTDKNKFSAEKDYIFYTSEVYYKKAGIDSLFIYTKSSSIPAQPPTKFSENIKVSIVELENNEELRDYEENYKKYGLNKVSAYE